MATKKPKRRTSVPSAKNVMRRAMEEILDPSPLDVGPVWDHFESRCAYCDIDLSLTSREAHMDHADHTGGNHLGNRVLSCRACNGDEKREMPWREFVTIKAPTPELAAERMARIESWIAAHPRTSPLPTPEAVAIAEEIEGLIGTYAAKCDDLRAEMRRAASR